MSEDCEDCEHLWALLRSEPYYSVMFTSLPEIIGRQDKFFCQRDPRHRLHVPSDDELLSLDRERYEMWRHGADAS